MTNSVSNFRTTTSSQREYSLQNNAGKLSSNTFECYALSNGNGELNDQSNKKFKVCTDTDSDGKTEIITDIKCKFKGKDFAMEVKVDPGSEANCIPLSHFRHLFPQLCKTDGLPKETALEESSKLLVINTHKGTYQFKQMPFGAKTSQDVFQIKMELIMEKCPGVISIHNDIVIYGTSDREHDANLIDLMSVAQLKSPVLNSKKLKLKRPQVSFFGAEYSCNGMHPCLKKIQGITEMTPPMAKQQLASFIGMVTCIRNFVPLSPHMEPLGAMLQ